MVELSLHPDNLNISWVIDPGHDPLRLNGVDFHALQLVSWNEFCR